MSPSSQRLQAKIEAMTTALVALVDGAVASAADTIVSEQQSRAPELTGLLAASIHKTKVGPMQYKITAGGPATTKDGYDYAIGQEFGNQHSAATPYFFSGYRARKRSAKRKIAKAIRDEIRAAAKS